MLASILPTPLHPVIVHLPIALAVLVPIFAIGTLVVIARGATVSRTWSVTVALLAALTASSWVSVETGETADEEVEAVVAEAPIETHEEAAEAFLAASAIVFGIALVGLARGRLGQGARLAGTVGTLVLVVMGWRVGHSGGALVYEHGAASAYTNAATAPMTPNGANTRTEEDDR
ncbi:MAG: hypothetical protein MUF00_21100 [Gemmatimonadaceae bacterium]|jgi:uncharacterized membrane protein|nr:hypothetical protein [Gemmatimonadaceae bacterium]